MRISTNYIFYGLLLSAFLMTLGWQELSVIVLFISALYYAYWVLNHRLASHKMEAFIYYFSLLVMMLITFTTIYQLEGIVCSGAVVHGFYESFYFSVVTWTTLGFGDCLPTSEIRHIAALQALMGYFMMAVFMGLFLALLSSGQSNSSNDKGT